MGGRPARLWGPLLLLALGLLVGWWRLGAPESSDPPGPIERWPTVGRATEEVLEPGTVHRYGIALDRGDVLRAVLDQQGVDLELRWLDPSGRNLLTVDTPNGPEGPEPMAAIARRSGIHVLEVSMASKSAGRYRLEILELRPATEIDRDWSRALSALRAGEADYRSAEARARRSAGDRLEEARDLFGVVGAPRLQALALRRLGQLAYAEGEVAEAIRHFGEALDLYPDHGNDWELLPLYNDAGSAYRLAGDPQRAEACFAHALALAERLRRPSAIATALNNLGMLRDASGDPEEALEHYQRALDLWRTLGRPEREANTLHNLGVSYLALGRTEEGVDRLRRALEQRRTQEDVAGQAATLTALGWARLLAGDLESALAACDEALDLRRRGGDRQGVAVSLDLCASAHRAAGEPEKALPVLRLALQHSTGSRLNEAYALADLGSLLCTLEQPDEALDHLDRSVELFRRVEDLNGLAFALGSRAEAMLQTGDLDRALADLEASIDIIESVRRRLQSRALRQSYVASRFDHYGATVEVLVRLAEARDDARFAARAFELSERARARTTLEGLVEVWADLRADAPSALLARERSLRERINGLETLHRARLDEPAATGAVESLAEELRADLLAYEELQAEIRRSSPLGRTLGEPRVLTLEEIQDRVLDDDTTLLVYTLAERQSVVWVVDRERWTTHLLPPRAEIEALARDLHDLLPNAHRAGRVRQADLVARALTARLLDPIRDRLVRPRLAIVPDGALHYLPMAALPMPALPMSALSAATADDPSPLLSEFEVVILPSASLLDLQRQTLADRPPAPRMLAVVADPVFEPDDARLSKRAPGRPPQGIETVALGLSSGVRGAGPEESRPLDSSPDPEGFHFERLRHSSAEATSILGLLPDRETSGALGFDANREWVTSGLLSDFRIVHFATHGVVRSDHPWLSGLVLSRFDADGRAIEALLRIPDILELELSADLVVLSACSTALGREVPGEGLLGLTQGFFYAGSRRLLVSLWNVDDRATAELMTRFYRALLDEGLEPAAALRSAQLAMRSEPAWRAPYYWAGFVLLGDWR